MRFFACTPFQGAVLFLCRGLFHSQSGFHRMSAPPFFSKHLPQHCNSEHNFQFLYQCLGIPSGLCLFPSISSTKENVSLLLLLLGFFSSPADCCPLFPYQLFSWSAQYIGSTTVWIWVVRFQLTNNLSSQNSGCMVLSVVDPQVAP